ncbi:4755_t:CDS:2 [Diversispora eburnea]|uniref:4755_t:CDS:1 n=1 Tax=Diversispora eburnea TaxID=1213867 RepID=A0A9N9ASK0_9GLOM|nr:4755_t:CDS:2 [Diversispora eburnea]
MTTYNTTALPRVKHTVAGRYDHNSSLDETEENEHNTTRRYRDYNSSFDETEEGHNTAPRRYRDYNSSIEETEKREHITRGYRDYNSSFESFDEAEESDSYKIKPYNRWRANSVSSSFGSTHVQGKKFDIIDEGNNKLSNSMRKYGRNWETDDELFKTTSQNIRPTSQQNHNSDNNNNPNEDLTTRSLLYLLKKERAKRSELQKIHDEFRKIYNDEVSVLEGDIQTLRNALVSEAKMTSQLNKLLREAQTKFTDEMKIWTRKVNEMETQGKELQKTFLETMEQLEREEEEIEKLKAENQKLRAESQKLRKQLDSCVIDLENAQNMESLTEDYDVSVKHTINCNVNSNNESETESIIVNSKISELKNRIIELESELFASKEMNQKFESSLQESETDKQAATKQLEEKHEKQVRLLRANITQQQKAINELQQEVHEIVHHNHRLLQNSKRRVHLSDLSENFPTKERKNSLTSTNSGSQSHRGSEETKSSIGSHAKNFTKLNSSQNHNDNEGNENELDLDAIFSDREDRSLPLLGHYSAAEYTEDEDFVDYTKLNSFF